MDLKNDYKRELLESIPVVSGMNIEILDIGTNHVTLSAPLDTNINYEGTAFGGSINTLGILSCYLLTHHILKNHQIEFGSLVIQSGSTDYLKPIDNIFQATAKVDDKSLESFVKMITRRGRARLHVESKIMCEGDSSSRAVFNGRFVASV
jgi:thioesterase domain-containing protein